MPPASIAYTLVGFSSQLDWRPLRFVKPIPPSRVCDACGVVRKRTALLPCRHILCGSCYEECTDDSGCVCPLDAHQCEKEDVDLKEFPAEDLLRREVMCWNETSDCRAVLSASEIANHFHHECRYHSIRCPRCSAAVLCGHVCTHLRSECSTAASEWDGDSSRNSEMALPTPFRQRLVLQDGELKTLLERLLVTSDANSDILNEISHGVNSCEEALRELRKGINSFKQTLRQEVVQGAAEQRECLNKCSYEIAAFREETRECLTANSEAVKVIRDNTHAVGKLLKDEFSKEAREKRDNGPQAAGSSLGAVKQAEKTNCSTGRMTKAVPGSHDPLASVCEFIVKNVSLLKDKPRKDLGLSFQSGRVYLRGYCMHPSVTVRLKSGGAALFASFRLKKGEMDNLVQWPFQGAIKLHFVHAYGGPELQLLERCFDPEPVRPMDGHADTLHVSSAHVLFENLFRDGYIKDDQLWVKFEVLL